MRIMSAWADWEITTNMTIYVLSAHLLTAAIVASLFTERERERSQNAYIFSVCIVPVINTRHPFAEFMSRPEIVKEEPWFGFEQEYWVTDRDGIPIGWEMNKEFRHDSKWALVKQGAFHIRKQSSRSATVIAQSGQFALYLRNFTQCWPRHAKTCFREYTDSKGPDRTAQMRSPIRAFALPLKIIWYHKM